MFIPPKSQEYSFAWINITLEVLHLDLKSRNSYENRKSYMSRTRIERCLSTTACFIVKPSHQSNVISTKLNILASLKKACQACLPIIFVSAETILVPVSYEQWSHNKTSVSVDHWPCIFLF